jgi:hypothetical protein
MILGMASLECKIQTLQIAPQAKEILSIRGLEVECLRVKMSVIMTPNPRKIKISKHRSTQTELLHSLFKKLITT